MVKEGYFKRGYLSQLAWTELWQDCLKINYTPMVNVKAIKPSKKKSKPDNNNNSEPTEQSSLDSEMVKALCETLKYAVKEDDLTLDAGWLQELTVQLHKTRAISVGGVLKEYLSEEELNNPDDLIHTDLSIDKEEGEEVAKIFFGWREKVKRYQKENPA